MKIIGVESIFQKKLKLLYRPVVLLLWNNNRYQPLPEFVTGFLCRSEHFARALLEMNGSKKIEMGGGQCTLPSKKRTMPAILRLQDISVDLIVFQRDGEVADSGRTR